MSKKLFLILFLIFTLFGCTANQKFSDGYAIVYKDKTPYLLNKNNELYDLSEYETIANSFSEYMVVSKYKNKVLKYGFINNSGKEVIKPQYDMAYAFSDGYAVVVEDDVYKLITIENEVVYEFPAGYKSYSSFKDGFLKVEKDGKFTFLNSDFQLCPDSYDSVENFNSGYALVTTNTNDVLTYNFIDENFNLLFNNELNSYDFVDSFYDGYARVGRYIDNYYYYSYIDNQGELLKDEAGYENFLIAENFHNNHALVYNGTYYDTVGTKYRYSPRFINTEGVYYKNYQDFYTSNFVYKLHTIDEDGKTFLSEFYFKSQVKYFVGDYIIVQHIDEGAGYWSMYKRNYYETNAFTGHLLDEVKLIPLSDNLSGVELGQYEAPYDMKQPKVSKFFADDTETVLLAVRIYTDKYAIIDGNGNYVTEAIFDNVIL